MPQYKHKEGPINICQKRGHELKAMTLSPELPNNMPIHDEKTSVQGDGIKFQVKGSFGQFLQGQKHPHNRQNN